MIVQALASDGSAGGALDLDSPEGEALHVALMSYAHSERDLAGDPRFPADVRGHYRARAAQANRLLAFFFPGAAS